MKLITKGWCDECMKQSIPVVEMETEQSRFCLPCLRAAVQMLEQASHKVPIQEHDTLTQEIDLYWQRKSL